jgi:hypothetical protein
VLAPCGVPHFLIDAFVESGLGLAAVRGEIPRVKSGHGRSRSKNRTVIEITEAGRGAQARFVRTQTS